MILQLSNSKKSSAEYLVIAASLILQALKMTEIMTERLKMVQQVKMAEALNLQEKLQIFGPT
jgi:hypothetical protein